MHKNNGRTKEEEFVFELNGKKANEVSHNLKHMLREMFGLFDGETIIECGLIDHYQKPDFYIKLGEVTKYVSLKSGRATDLWEINVKDFIFLLREFDLSVDSQKTILIHHFGDGTMDGSGKERMDYTKLRYLLKDRIEKLNIELNEDKEAIKEIVYRAMFKGNQDTNVEADYIYYGDTKYGVTCSKNQIFKHIERRSWDYMENPHIGPLQFRPHARYIGKEIKNEHKRWQVIIYWANLGSDLNYIAERYDD